jgi:AcrR family transcriptional regulator
MEATVDEIVREAGVARGTFYIYFSDKFDMLRALTAVTTRTVFEEAHVRLDATTTPFRRIESSITAILLAWQAQYGVLRSLYQLSIAREEFRSFQLALRKPFTDALCADLSSSMARGYARPVNARIAAEALATMVSFTCMDWFALDIPPCEGATIPGVAHSLALIWYRAVYGADPEDSGE